MPTSRSMAAPRILLRADISHRREAPAMRDFFMSKPSSSGDATPRVASGKVRTIDVRPVIARGEEPFKVVMIVVASLRPYEGFVLVSPFLPSPLIERLQGEGFRARPERRSDGAWQTSFLRS